tara:strand:+ start:100 stop:477 length:378 start_codon:yes stop_codon:yes gene_type:complete
METEQIKFEDFKHACRLIAERIVADIKLYPNSSIRPIINAYWECLPRLKVNRAKRILELFKETDMGTMPTFYAEVEIRDCIMDANSRIYLNPSEEAAKKYQVRVQEFALELKHSADFYKQMEELE